NGAVQQTGSARLRFTSSSFNVLDGVTLTGDLDLSDSTRRVRIRGGLTLSSGRVRLGTGGGIGFEGDQVFNGEILLEGDSGLIGIEGASTLTLGPDALVHGRGGRIGPAIFFGGTATL